MSASGKVPVLIPAGGAGVSEGNSSNAGDTTLRDSGIFHVVSATGIRMVPYGLIADAVKSGKPTGKGATGARIITVNGKKMIYKAGPMGRVANEYIAYQLYAAAGARVPRSYLVMNVNVEGGGEKAIPMAIMTEFLEDSLTVRQVLEDGIPVPSPESESRLPPRKPGMGRSHMMWGKTLKEQKMKKRRTAKAEGRASVPLKIGEQSILRYALRSEFVYHALFLNWDAKNADNHMVVPEPPKPAATASVASSASSEGTKWSLLSYNTTSSESITKPVGLSYDYDHPVTIDLGGSLFYRAMGETKAKRFLIPDEIQELLTIPEKSADTRLKLYAELRDKRTLHGVVCATAAKIDSERILAVVEAMRPLFKFLPVGADLPGLISGRLAALRAYCEGRYNLEAVEGEAGDVEYKMNRGEGPIDFRKVRPRDMPLMRKKAAAEELLRKRYPIVATSLVEEAVAPLRMAGKRSVSALAGQPVSRDELGLVVVNDEWEPPSEEDEAVSENDNTGAGGKHKYPKPLFTIVQNSTPLARSIRSKVLAAPEDPAIEGWLRRQEDYIDNLSVREYDILTAYTRNGDILVNEYLRRRLVGDVTGLMEAMLRVDPDYPDRPVALGYSIYDQFPELVRSRKIYVMEGYLRQEDLLIPMTEGGSRTEDALDMDAIRVIIINNMDFFGRAENILPLVEQYYQELRAIIEKAPRAPHAFRVFRGIRSEAHLRGLSFTSVDFLSTALTPDKAVKVFTSVLEDKSQLVSREYHCCLYELEVNPAVPCIYMEPVSQFSGEFEVLVAPGMTVRLEPTVHLKRYVDPEEISHTSYAARKITDGLTRKVGGIMVSVVEGSIGRAARKETARAVSGLLEGSLDDMAVAAATMVRRPLSAERFAGQKPRGMTVGRNRTRRRSTAVKSVRRKTRKNSTE